MLVARLAFITVVVCGTLAGCGRPGFPVPPDDYGVGLRMQQERKKEAQAAQEQEAREAAAKQKPDDGLVTPPDEVTLPDMRPVGGR